MTFPTQKTDADDELETAPGVCVGLSVIRHKVFHRVVVTHVAPNPAWVTRLSPMSLRHQPHGRKFRNYCKRPLSTCIHDCMVVSSYIIVTSVISTYTNIAWWHPLLLRPLYMVVTRVIATVVGLTYPMRQSHRVAPSPRKDTRTKYQTVMGRVSRILHPMWPTKSGVSTVSPMSDSQLAHLEHEEHKNDDYCMFTCAAKRDKVDKLAVPSGTKLHACVNIAHDNFPCAAAVVADIVRLLCCWVSST